MSIQSIKRAAAILRLFENTTRPLGISEMAHSLQLPQPTVHGLVSTLVEEGFLQHDPDIRKYRLGFKLYELGIKQTSNLEINQKALHPLKDLVNKTDCIGRVGICDQNAILITMNLYPSSERVSAIQFGPRVHLYCSAIGKAVLAFMDRKDRSDYLQNKSLIPLTSFTITDPEVLEKDLEQIRTRGYSISRQESLAYQAGLGAPIFKDSAQIAGAISMQIHPEAIDTEFMLKAAAQLLHTAQNISMAMGASLTPSQPDVSKINALPHKKMTKPKGKSRRRTNVGKSKMKKQ